MLKKRFCKYRVPAMKTADAPGNDARLAGPDDLVCRAPRHRSRAVGAAHVDRDGPVLDLGGSQPGADQLGLGHPGSRAGTEPVGDDRRARRSATPSGPSLFALFCVMGQRTGVNAMVLARLTLGRRGAYVVAAVMVLMPMGWVGVNTWVVLDLAVAAMDRLGIDADAGPLRYAIAGVIVVIQVVITAWGFNAIRLFERWTMPVVLAVMLVMTVVSAFHVNG